MMFVYCVANIPPKDEGPFTHNAGPGMFEFAHPNCLLWEQVDSNF